MEMTREYVVKVTDALMPDAFQRFENEWSPEQEIVRCENCAHWHELKDSDPSRGVCKIWHMLHHGGWFCADGEAKRDG